MDSSPRLNVAAMASRPRSVSGILGLTLVTTVLLACVASSTQAAITWTGNVDPNDPTKWISDTDGYIGKSSTGEITVDDASVLLSQSGYIGYNSDTTGSVTVTGNGSEWTNNYGIYIGNYGTGTLTIENGGQVNNAYYGFLGYNSGSIGSVTVTGSGSRWTNSSGLIVGNSGTGTLTIEAGGQVSNASSGYIGDNSGSSGLVIVTGPGSKWINYNNLEVGRSGTSTLTIEDGGQVSSYNSTLGCISGSNGSVTVIGSGSKWTNSDFLTIGDSGQGTLTLAAGGQVSNHDSCIGYRSGTGSVTVNGIGSTWTNSGVLYVGFSGSGTLTIEAGGQVSNNDSCIGYNSGSTSSVTVNGIGSTWTNTDRLYVGGTGTLTIEAGGQVSSTFGYIDAGSNSSGTVTVTGNGSKWINSVELYVGNFGTSTLNIGSGIASDGVVAAKYLILANPSSAKGICNLNGGTLQVGSISKGTGTATFNWSDGTIRNYDASTGLAINGNNSLTLKLAATGTHAFYIDAGHTGMVSAILSDATSEGTLTKVGGGLLMLTKENTFTGQMTISAGTLLLYNTGSLASALIDVQSGATFNVSGISGYSLGAGKTLTGSGTVVGNLSVSGIHAPGDSLGIETVKGNYSLLGELQIELAGTTAGSGYDQVLQSGSIAYSTTTLGGKLSLDWTGFSGSTDSTKLWILKNDTAGVLSGTFSNYENGASLGVYDGRAWYIDYGANFATGSLTGGNDVVIFTVPEPATIVLLGMVAMGLGAVGWQRRK